MDSQDGVVVVWDLDFRSGFIVYHKCPGFNFQPITFSKSCYLTGLLWEETMYTTLNSMEKSSIKIRSARPVECLDACLQCHSIHLLLLNSSLSLVWGKKSYLLCNMFIIISFTNCCLLPFFIDFSGTYASALEISELSIQLVFYPTIDFNGAISYHRNQ